MNLQKVTKASLHSLQENDQMHWCGSPQPGGTCPDNGSLLIYVILCFGQNIFICAKASLHSFLIHYIELMSRDPHPHCQTGPALITALLQGSCESSRSQNTLLHSLQDAWALVWLTGPGDGTCPDNGSLPRLCLHPGPLDHMGIQ